MDKDIREIPPFRRFVIQNFPFIEEDFDALTTYALISKIVEYLNLCISETNSLSKAVEEIEDYLKTLDIEEYAREIINKLIEDGELYQELTYNSSNESLTLTLTEGA